MNKVLVSLMLLFFISGLFVVAFNPVSASGLVADSWSTKTAMKTERTAFGVATVDGKIYVIGGYTDYSTFLSVNERYDPKTDKWSTLKSMPTPRHGFGIVACDGKIYCMGGTFYEAGQWFSCKANEVYDPVTNSWSAKASTPFEGFTTMVQAVNGKIFVIAGAVGLAGELYQYDPVTDLWTQKDKPPRVDFTSSAVVNNKIVVYCNLYSWMSPFEAKTRMYDVETGKWSGMKTQPFVSTLISDSYRYPPEYTLALSGATTGLFAPQRIYSFFEGKTFVHDIAHDTWLTAKSTTATGSVGAFSGVIPFIDKDMPATMPRTANMPGCACVAVVDDVFYVVGSTFTEQYVPIGYSTMSLSSEPITDSEHFLTNNTHKPPPTQPSSEPITDSEHFLTASVMVAIVLTVGVVVPILFFYFRGRIRRKRGTYA